MIDGLRPYPSYKDSGVEWLGSVPEGWEVRRLKDATELIVGGATPKADRPAYWNGGIAWVTPSDVVSYSHLTRTDRTLSRDGLEACSATLVRAGAVVLTSRAPVGNVALVEIPAATNQGCKSILVKKDFLHQEYVLALLETMKPEIQSWATGTTFAEISTDQVARLQIPIPPFDDQLAMARFLYYFNLRIQQLMSAKERMIDLLEEEKQAIVYRAATNGLEHDLPCKPSGIDWLGDVPAHWEVAPLKRITKSRCDGPFGSGLASTHYTDHGIRVIRLQNISSGGFIDVDRAFISEGHYVTLGEHDVTAGDLLVAGLGDDKRYVGRACVAPEGIEPAMVKADCFRFRLRPGQHSEFLARQLSATARLMAGLARGSTRQRINLESMSVRPVVLPPRDEQVAIAKYLDDAEGRINKAADGARRQIEFLREYRVRLISDVVTGKLDVREAAANLPDDPDADDPALDEHLEEVAAA